MKAKKMVTKTIEGEYELIRNHVIDIDVNRDLIYSACDKLDIGDDPEQDYNEYGICTNEDGEPEYIDIGKFLKGIDRFISESDDELDLDDMKKLKMLSKYKDYTLYCQNKIVIT